MSSEKSLECVSACLAWECYARDDFKKHLAETNTTAMRNLLRIALEAECVEEVWITLEYQEARKAVGAFVIGELKKGVQAIKAANRSEDELVCLRTFLNHVVRLQYAAAVREKGKK